MGAYRAWFGFGAAVLIAAGACGGESTGDGAGNEAGAGGSAGSSGEGGTSGWGGAGCPPGPDCINACGMFYGGCVDGKWSCVDPPACDAGGFAGCGGGGAMDCVDPCDGHMYLPSCVNGGWTCAGGDVCDGGADAAPCASGTVPTIEGCLSCADATTKLADAIESARLANAACNQAADCMLTGAGTACWGDCPAAVSKSGEQSFQFALTKLDADYCSAFVPECGYSTPKCAVPTLVCASGKCEATY